eukprot:scaffold51632_cov24-Cyclotella_meneghiniana.AAC.1
MGKAVMTSQMEVHVWRHPRGISIITAHCATASKASIRSSTSFEGRSRTALADNADALISLVHIRIN